MNEQEIIRHICENTCYRMHDALEHPHHAPGTCALGWRKPTAAEVRDFLMMEAHANGLKRRSATTTESVTPHAEAIIDALATGLAECMTGHSSCNYVGADDSSKRRLDAITESAYASLRKAAEIRQSQPTASPAEELIDELTRQLWACREYIIVNAPDTEPMYAILRDIASACARATAHQEARRHA